MLNEENEYGSFPLFENSKKKSMKLVHLTAFSRFGRRIEDLTTCTFKKEENYIGQSLFKSKRREKNINFGECSVVEFPYNSNTIKTNCGDTHGSSGTGYVNEYGHLVAIHRSQSSFLEFYKNGNNIQFALDSQKEVYNLYLDDEKDLNESSVIKVFFKCFT